MSNEAWLIGEQKQASHLACVCRMKELIGPAEEAGKQICPGARKFLGARNDLNCKSAVTSRMHDVRVS